MQTFLFLSCGIHKWRVSLCVAFMKIGWTRWKYEWSWKKTSSNFVELLLKFPSTVYSKNYEYYWHFLWFGVGKFYPFHDYCTGAGAISASEVTLKDMGKGIKWTHIWNQDMTQTMQTTLKLYEHFWLYFSISTLSGAKAHWIQSMPYHLWGK